MPPYSPAIPVFGFCVGAAFAFGAFGAGAAFGFGATGGLATKGRRVRVGVRQEVRDRLLARTDDGLRERLPLLVVRVQQARQVIEHRLACVIRLVAVRLVLLAFLVAEVAGVQDAVGGETVDDRLVGEV